jgi:hypothetical protein
MICRARHRVLAHPCSRTVRSRPVAMHAAHVHLRQWVRRDIKMTCHAQTEINEVWDQIEDGTIGVSSKIVTHRRFIQALRTPIAVRYRDHSDRMTAGYLRQRVSEDSTWGLWQETL